MAKPGRLLTIMRDLVSLAVLCCVVGCAERTSTLEEDVTRLGGRYLVNDRGLVQADFANSAITNEDLASIQNLNKLSSLVLKHTAVDNAGLVHLKSATQLETLDLSHTQVSDAGLEFLTSLSNLQFLALEGCAVTEMAVERFQNSVRDVVVVADIYKDEPEGGI